MRTDIIETQQKNIQSGERTFNTEFLPHADALYGFAYRLTNDEADAKDLVQDTMMKAFRYFDYYQKDTNAKSWLFKIMQNHFINGYRKKSKQPTQVELEQFDFIYRYDTSNADYSSYKTALSDEVLNALNSLSVNLKTVVILCDLQGFKYEEIAKILDIPLGTVKTRLHKARQILKQKLIGFVNLDNRN